MKMEEYEYKLRFWTVIIGIATVLSSIFSPITIERIATLFLLLVLISLLSEKRKNLLIPIMVFSGLYWLSTFLSGTLAFVASLSGIGFAGIIAIVLVDLRDIEEPQKKKEAKNSE